MCKENRVLRSPLKLLVLQRKKVSNTSDTLTRLYNFCHKTGSGFIRERLVHILEECNALLAHSAVYTHHGRAEFLMYMQNYAH